MTFKSDDLENKSGSTIAIDFINTKLTQFFKGKELPLSKKMYDNLGNWIEKMRVKALNASQENSVAEGQDEDEANKTANTQAMR